MPKQILSDTETASRTLKQKLQIKANKLKNELIAVYYAFRDPRVKWGPRLIIALALGYALSPIDLIPDFIPVLGYLDDLIIIPALITLAIRLIPGEVMQQSRVKAEQEPLVLKKNWGFAVVFIGIWIILLGAVVWGIVRLFDK